MIFSVGDSVKLIHDYDVFPHGIVKAGNDGVIKEIDTVGQIVHVKLDEHHSWLDEWENVLDVYYDHSPIEHYLKGCGYKWEFPDFKPETMPAIPEGWTDVSWHNDACPSFHVGDLQVFVDFADPDERDIPEGSRFSVIEFEGRRPDLIDTDDWNVVLQFVAERAKP